MTTEGQGRAADPVGLGIPVVIDGPWAEPRIYPEMAGILDNPDAAYAKLKEMGKGLFGASGGGLGGARRIGRRIERRQRRTVRPARRQARRDPGQSAAAGFWPKPRHSIATRRSGQRRRRRPHRRRAIPTPQATQDSQPMNDVLRQLFNR